MFEPKSIQSESLSGIPVPQNDPHVDEFIKDHIVLQSRDTDIPDIRYLKRSKLNDYLRDGRNNGTVDRRLTIHAVEYALNGKTNFPRPYNGTFWIPKENPLHAISKTIKGWRGVYLKDVEDDNDGGNSEEMEVEENL